MDFRPERLHDYVPPQDNLKERHDCPSPPVSYQGYLTVFLPTIHTT